MAKREYLRIVEENRDHSNITRANKVSNDGDNNNNDTSAVIDNPG